MGLGGRLAQVYGEATLGAEEIRRKREEREQAKIVAQLNQAALIAGMRDQGIMPASEMEPAPASTPMPVTPIKGGPQFASISVPNVTPDRPDSSRYEQLGKTGYLRDKSVLSMSPRAQFQRDVVALRALLPDHPIQEVIAIAQNKEARDSYLKKEPEKPPHYDSERGVLVENSGDVTVPKGLPAKPDEWTPLPATSRGLFEKSKRTGEVRPLMADGQQLQPHQTNSEPNWQVQQTPAGYVQVNPKNGEVRPVLDSSGKQVRPQAPEAIVKAVINNRQQLTTIDNAIALLKKHPTAVGLRRGIPDAANQIIDPEGVDTRAAVTNIGSLLIHDRTGAAMNASESVRLKPFIPGPTDQAKAAIKKLTALKYLLQSDTEFLSQSYGIDGGAAGNGSATDPGAWLAARRKQQP